MRRFYRIAYILFILLLFAAPFLPSLIAEYIVFPMQGCDDYQYQDLARNDNPICGNWNRMAFGSGFVILLTWPAAILILTIHLIIKLVKTSRKKP